MDMSLSKLREMVKYRKAWHAACSPWGRKESDTTGRLNNNRVVLRCMQGRCWKQEDQLGGHCSSQVGLEGDVSWGMGEGVSQTRAEETGWRCVDKSRGLQNISDRELLK